MSGAIGPGDILEALKDQPSTGVFRGKLYTVLEIIPPLDVWPCTECGDEGDGFTLIETHDALDNGCYCHCGFRPIYRPKADAFDYLLRELKKVFDNEKVEA